MNFGEMKVPDLEVGRILFLISIPMAVVSILIQPTIGSISDYTISRWGRRKPYIVFGSLLDLVFLFGIATSNSILMIGVFVTLLSFSTNIARGPFQGYVPDLIHPRQVGMASALVGLMQILGNVTGFVRSRSRSCSDGSSWRSPLSRSSSSSRWSPSYCGSAPDCRRSLGTADPGGRSSARPGEPTSSRSARTSGS